MGFEEQEQGVTVIGVTTKRAHSGTHSLQAQGSAGYMYTFCPIGSEASLASKTVEAWVFVEPNSGSVDNDVTCRFAPLSSHEAIDTPVARNKWVNVSITADKTPTHNTSVSITCWPNDIAFYVDDLTIR